MQRRLEAEERWPKSPSGRVPSQTVQYLLRKIIYAGDLDILDWGVSLVPATHESLVSLETWRRVQDRIENRGHAPARKDLNRDFPLRGFLACDCCGNNMTAAWFKGRGRPYP